MKPARFSLFLLLGALVSAGISSLVLEMTGRAFLFLPASGLLLWVLMLTSASYLWLFSSLSGSGPAFMNRILGVTMLRLMLSIGLVFLLWFLYPDQVVPLVILFFFYYSAALAFEIFQLLRNLRDISK